MSGTDHISGSSGSSASSDTGDARGASRATRQTRRAFAIRSLARMGALGLAALGGAIGEAALAPLAGARGVVEAAGEQDRPRLLRRLFDDAEKQPDRTFRVIVQRRNRDRDADRHVTRRGGRKLRDLRDSKSDAFVAELKGRELAELGRHGGVKWITLDAPMVNAGTVDTSRLASVYSRAVNAAGLASSGITGAGVGVAVIDTGITDARPDFRIASGSSSHRIAANVLFNASLKGTADGHGHGTHVAGIIAGNSWHSGDSAVKGKYVGIAPEAKLIDVRVSDDQGMSYVSDVVDAIDWVIANRTTHNIRVLNLSLVSSVAEPYSTSILAAAAEKAWFNGIFVVVAAGNAGPNTALFPPANDPFVITVGASDPLGSAERADDGMAPWSSYGLTQAGHTKPDVVAPGRYITAPRASSGATLAETFPDRVVDSNYIWLSGTSMAAPVVAGIAALAFQVHPEWTNDQLKWLLMNTATRLGGANPLPGQGAGLVDAQKVVQYAGTPGYANQGLTISAQLVTANGTTIYASSSWSTSSWSTSSWSTSSWSTSSWSTSSWSTSSWSTSTWSAASLQSTHVE